MVGPFVCSGWFWIIPIVGMVLMVGMMFFMCRSGPGTGWFGPCGCGRADDHSTRDRAEDRGSPPSATPRA